MAATAKKKTASKKVRSAKTTRKSTAKKATPKAKAVSAGNSKDVTLNKLKKFNIFAAVSNAIFAVLSVVFISKDTVVANLPYAAKDEFASTATTVFGAAYKTLCEVEIRYILAFIFGLSAIFSLLLATRLQAKYNAQLAKSSSILRWVFTGISLGLIVELSSKLTNVDNAVTLKTIGALIVVTSILWIISEQQNNGTKGKLSIFYLSLFTLFLAVMPLISSLIASGVYGMEWFGWHVYLLAFAVISGLAVIAYSQYKSAKYGVSAKGYLELEGKYLSVDYLVKFSAFIILLIALLK
jgi:hypothetical protein